MAVLTRDAILAELDAGRLVVTPFERDQLGAASIDLTLGDEIRIIERGAAPIDVVNDADYRAHTRVQRLDEPYVLEPGLTIHGITRERIGLPQNLCGFLEGRSRFARLGLMIHVGPPPAHPPRRAPVSAGADAHRGRGELSRALRRAVPALSS
jgi:dCTP deaminase